VLNPPDDANPEWGNNNHFQVNNCFVNQSGRNGFHTESGGDTSSGLVLSLHSYHNKEWGIFDNSTFGVTFIACSCYANSSGAYKSRGGAMFINCYTEGDQSSEVNPPGIIIGGNVYNIPTVGEAPLNTNNFIAGAATPSYIDKGIGGFSLFSKTSKLAFACLGGSEDTALALRAVLKPFLTKPDPNNPVNIIPADKSDNMFGTIPDEEPAIKRTDWSYLNIDTDGWWKMNTQGQTAFAFSTDKADEGVSHFWMPKGFFIGGPYPSQYLKKKITSSNFDQINREYQAKESLHPYLSNIGDIVWNNDPDVNAGAGYKNFAGFICINDPEKPGHKTWAGFGRIETIEDSPSSDGTDLV
jgi:hypothetical protein